MSFDPWWLLLSLLVSGVGFVLFVYGRRMVRVPHLIVGLASMLCPYVAGSVVGLAAVAAALWVGLWVALRLGW